MSDKNGRIFDLTSHYLRFLVFARENTLRLSVFIVIIQAYNSEEGCVRSAISYIFIITHTNCVLRAAVFFLLRCTHSILILLCITSDMFIVFNIRLDFRLFILFYDSCIIVPPSPPLPSYIFTYRTNMKVFV